MTHCRCNTCGELKPATPDFFSRDAKASGGLSKRCKICTSSAGKRWRMEQGQEFIEKERVRQKTLRQRPEKKEMDRARLQAWRAVNPDKLKAQKHEQPYMKAERQRRRVAKQLNATPAWADLSAIQKIYAEAHLLSKETGVKHVVDHIVPLRGREVSGLHVHQNLRVVPAAVNARKSNRFIPELLGANYG